MQNYQEVAQEFKLKCLENGRNLKTQSVMQLYFVPCHMSHKGKKSSLTAWGVWTGMKCDCMLDRDQEYCTCSMDCKRELNPSCRNIANVGVFSLFLVTYYFVVKLCSPHPQGKIIFSTPTMSSWAYSAQTCAHTQLANISTNDSVTA